LVAFLISFLVCAGIADLEELAKRHEIQWSCEAATGRHTLRCGTTTLVFAPGLQSALVNGSPIPLIMPVTVESGRIKLPAELARYVEAAPLRATGNLVKAPAVKPAAPPQKEDPNSRLLAGVKIAIDPGHGGLHTGGKGNAGLMEKDINLGVALNLQKILESWGARVVMTRTQDGQFHAQVDDDLEARVQIVNAAKPDLFLSIHTNYVANAGPRGFEVWVPRCGGQRNVQSRDLAEQLRKELADVWGNNQDRGTKDDHNLRVLKGTSCPAALVELEFVSNPAVERQLGQPAKQRELATAIAEAAYHWATRHLR
jgi:N-acetylmuramoyl-L-alanine amidase